MKKLVSIMLALIMVFSLATVAFAEGETQDYTELKKAAEFVWGIYQDHICQHKLLSGESALITKGCVDCEKGDPDADHMHRWMKVCALCGHVEYEKVECEFNEYPSSISKDGFTQTYYCQYCPNSKIETPVGHKHVMKLAGYGMADYKGFPAHYPVYECECGYHVEGMTMPCIPLTDHTDFDGYSHMLCCSVCDRVFLEIPTVEQVIRDVTDNIKAQALEAAENAINAQITKVLETVYNSLTQEQQDALKNLWNAVNFVVELWTPNEGYIAPNGEV